VVSAVVYGTTLVLLYVFSTVYHSTTGQAKALARIFDHNAIYLLIAGTYTPFTLITLHGVWGWTLFAAIWALALVGIVIDSMPRKGRRIVPVILYLVMGWLGVVAIKPLLAALPAHAFDWLLAGGIAYTVGVAFYVLGKIWRPGHAIWHVLILVGSACHYFVITGYVI
ncbi:MAG: hemolysin III family protein, partial [Gammaproteobacteria bacterium]